MFIPNKENELYASFSSLNALSHTEGLEGEGRLITDTEGMQEERKEKEQERKEKEEDPSVPELYLVDNSNLKQVLKIDRTFLLK